jgi:hypothetical protein
MAYSYKFNNTNGLIEIVLAGSITKDELQEIVSSCIRLAKKHNSYNWLYDFSYATFDYHSIDMIALQKKFDDMVSELGAWRFVVNRAVVSQDVTYDKALEAVIAHYHSERLKIFDNISQARAWLQDRTDK